MKQNVINSTIQKYKDVESNEWYEQLDLDKEKNALLDFATTVESYKFKIAVIGEFSTGKSTLINALIHDKILPSAFVPTTNQIFSIENTNDKDETFFTDEEGSKQQVLTKQSLSDELKRTSANVHLKKHMPQELKDYVLYDTPGVNDPSMLSDEIVFDLIGSVDIVLFVMDSKQALKQTELEFLTKLIREKDIEKFLFVLNQADQIEDEKAIVKTSVVQKLSETMGLDKNSIAEHTFLISSTQSIEAVQNNDNNALNYTGYNHLVGYMNSFISKNAKKLRDEMISNEISNILAQSLQKVSVAVDQLNGKDKQYQKALNEIRKEIEDFENEIEKSILEFREKFDTEKLQYKNEINDSFEAIKEEIKGNIEESNLKVLSENRFIEIRTKKLIEDALSQATTNFVQKIADSMANLDRAITPQIEAKNIVINNIVFKDNMAPIVKGVAIAGTVVAGVAMLPSMGAVALTGGVAAVAGVGLAVFAPAALAVVGTALPGVISVVGSVAGVAITIAGKAVTWGIDAIGNVTNKFETYKKKFEYQKYVAKSIDDIKKQILEGIDKQFDIDKILQTYIEDKFPQKKELEERISIANKQTMEKSQALSQDLDVLVQLKTVLEA